MSESMMMALLIGPIEKSCLEIKASINSWHQSIGYYSQKDYTWTDFDWIGRFNLQVFEMVEDDN